jgi:hypothetical protein
MLLHQLDDGGIHQELSISKNSSMDLICFFFAFFLLDRVDLDSDLLRGEARIDSKSVVLSYKLLKR